MGWQKGTMVQDDDMSTNLFLQLKNRKAAKDREGELNLAQTTD